MSEVQKQIERNRRDAAIQKMNSTLVATDTHAVASKPSGELPVFGEPIQKVIQNLNPKDGTDKR